MSTTFRPGDVALLSEGRFTGTAVIVTTVHEHERSSTGEPIPYGVKRFDGQSFRVGFVSISHLAVKANGLRPVSMVDYEALLGSMPA